MLDGTMDGEELLTMDVLDAEVAAEFNDDTEDDGNSKLKGGDG